MNPQLCPNCQDRPPRSWKMCPVCGRTASSSRLSSLPWILLLAAVAAAVLWLFTALQGHRTLDNGTAHYGSSPSTRITVITGGG